MLTMPIPDQEVITRRAAIAADHKTSAARSGRTQILDHHAQFHLLADNAKAWRRDQAQAPINFAWAAGDQHMKGRIEGQHAWRVMHLAIGQRDNTGKPCTWHIGQGRTQSRE